MSNPVININYLFKELHVHVADSKNAKETAEIIAEYTMEELAKNLKSVESPSVENLSDIEDKPEPQP
jgi:ERCC4-type nuclease